LALPELCASAVMTDYALTGKKGTGKSKHAVILIRDRYLKKKRLVATNLDLNIEPMFGSQSKVTYVRIPDKPKSFDLLAAGHGNPDSYDEDLNGALVLDEMGTWLNTRTFADKDRAAVLDYFAHARKHGFDTWYIMQNVVQVDKQLRESFIEQTVRHTSFAKVKIPFFGSILGALFGERAAFLPRFHAAVFRIGVNPQDMICNRAVFTGKDVEPCYDTRQVFLENYPHGTHSVLSPWHIKGRFEAQKAAPWWLDLFNGLLGRSVAVPAPRVSVRVPLVRDPVAVRAALLAKRLPVDRRISFIQRYSQACYLINKAVPSSGRVATSVSPA
jgi:hypothetical protein